MLIKRFLSELSWLPDQSLVMGKYSWEEGKTPGVSEGFG